MNSYEAFKERHYPTKKKWRDYSAAELVAVKGRLPKEVVEFMNTEGISSYSNHFLWTTHPDNFHEVLSDWGLPGQKCHAFMRTAFGACIYYQKDECFYLDPLEGRISSLGDDASMVLDIYLVMDAILTGALFEDYYSNLKVDRNLLDPETIFGFVPALPIGGSFKKSKVEVMQMKEHLFLLAQLFDHKATLVE